MKVFNKTSYLILSVILLGFLAGLRGEDVGKDYLTYQRVFDLYSELKVNDGFLSNFEPGFSFIILLLKRLFTLNYGIWIMLFFSFTSIIIRLYSFSKIAINPFLVLLFYYSHYFFLHEMTQIRIALASSIFIFGLIYYLRGKKIAYIFFVLIAASFHYSAILYFAVFLIDNKYFNKVFTIIALCFAIIFGIIKFPLLTLVNDVNIANYSPKVSHYTTVVEAGLADPINVFNIYNIFSIGICLYLIIFIPIQRLREDPWLLLSLRFVILSILLLSVLSGIPSLSFRFSEVFGVMDIFVFASLSKYLPFKKWNILITVGIALCIFALTIFYGDLVKPYELIEFK